MKNSKLNFLSVASLVTFFAVVIMFTLGVWQIQRAQEKTDRLLSIQEAENAGQMTLHNLLKDNSNNMLDMSISMEGEADPIRYFLVDNKINQGRVGYHVLVPIKTLQGWVLANFGWIAAMNSRNTLPAVKLHSDLTEYFGMVTIPTKNVMVQETAKLDGEWPKLLQQVDIEIMQQHLQQDLLPFVVLLNQDLESGFERHWQRVVMPPEKHLAYAAQWFLLAIAAVVIFVVAHRKKQQRNTYESR
ncbi:SURF1 family protein [uncultured Paraglaciecola sp.]|uniref:SURF1 family protein n=1 Tax=uncultured Paraglaciecola sp. TaxID=1765024 RepID=UPI002598EFA5|nr:SURF1 family protein [uncultured Paraglaciecola sp.]